MRNYTSRQFRSGYFGIKCNPLLELMLIGSQWIGMSNTSVKTVHLACMVSESLQNGDHSSDISLLDSGRDVKQIMAIQ